MENPQKSSVVKLVNYLSDSQDKQERVENVRVTNCGRLDGDNVDRQTAEDAALDMAVAQARNTKATSDKTYHLLISFRAGDEPDAKALKEIEAAFCDALGFSEHQRVSAVHRDTDNLHIHVAINKIHPTRLTIHNPYNDNWTRDQLAADLEKKYGLQPDNHIHKQTQSQTRVADMEAHSGEQSLVSWIKQECLTDLKAAQSWDDLKQVLSENGLELRQRGNGFVFQSTDGTIVKASTVDRALSKPGLEKRLGPFPEGRDSSSHNAGDNPAKRPTARKDNPRKQYQKRPIPVRLDTSHLYARYQVERAASAESKKTQMRALSDERKRRIDVAKDQARLKRSALKLGRGRVAKRLAYWQINQALTESLASINADIVRQKKELGQAKPQTWADWLRTQAVKGDADALAVMRAKDSAAIKRADRKNKESSVAASGGAASKASDISPDGITKTGTIIFKAPTGSGAVRDDGKQLSLSKQADDAALLFAMRTAAERDGSVLSLTGSAEFQKRAAKLAGQSGLAVTFRDSELEKIRQQEAENVRRTEPAREPDKSAAQRERPVSPNRRNDGRVSDARTREQRGSSGEPRNGRNGRAGGDGGDGRTVTTDRDAFYRAIRKATEKPYLGSSGRFPAAPPTNSMRKLSGIPMAFDARRGEVLVPPYARDGLDNQRPDRNPALRRPGNIAPTGAVTGLTPDLAAKKYVHERSESRLRGFDIPKHSIYSGGAGELVFVGIRRVENHPLALMKKADQSDIFVLPIDTKTEQRLAQIRRGSRITVTPEKAILTKQGTRRRGR
jgi:hypothetical protein